MSELINNQNRRNVRWQLLSTVCALSLLCVCAEAQAADKPTLWIELGGQLERIDGRQAVDLPPVMTHEAGIGPLGVLSPYDAQKASIYSYGAEGKIAFQPKGTAWQFSAAVRYGRSNNNKHEHQQTQITDHYLYKNNPLSYKNKTAQVFADFRAKNAESHMVLDFQAGRDVGLGWLSSVASFGIRMAEFSSYSHANSIVRPEVGFTPRFTLNKYIDQVHHTDVTSVSDSTHNFHGIGPSLSWEGNVPVLHGEDRTVTFDWGLNAAALFGRQKVRGTHQTTARYYPSENQITTPPYGVVIRYQPGPKPQDRTRSVVIPNVGGLAGISFRYSALKISFGYRADFFFGAMDAGVDARETADRNFYGPYATISIGLGG